MLKMAIVSVFAFSVNCFITYGQSQYDVRLMNIKPTLSRQVSYLLQDSTPCEIIIYSVFNLDYHIVISKGKNNYNLFFFRLKETDTLPVLMYYSYIPSSDKDFEKLFNKDFYWKERIFFNNPKSDNFGTREFDANMSDFYYYNKGGDIIAEFHYPTISDGNPLQVNHQFLLDLRMDLILKYIFWKNNY